jgi:phytanoyl-CoA hydroxylase
MATSGRTVNTDAAARRGPTRHARDQAQIERLRDVGYVVVPDFIPRERLAGLKESARQQLAQRAAPRELEADIQYPGAPSSRDAPGGDTVRRLLDAYGRDARFAQEATAPLLRQWMSRYFHEPVRMSRVHHNCLMTKHPRYGSETGWHRDIRYWAFDREELVSAWLALGDENAENGGLRFVPGSHRMRLAAGQFDAASFFRTDLPQNADILGTAQVLQLAAGDAVFFHCSLLHSAGSNGSQAVKFSLVFTYHGVSNAPISGTRSASMPEITLDEDRWSFGQ